MNECDLLIIIPPERNEVTVYPPYGAMYICSALRRNGYTPAILNLDLERLPFSQAIDRIKRINPRYIGFSGIVSTSYGIIKKLSPALKNELSDCIQILGGGLSAAWEPVFTNTSIDFIVKGEGDETIVDLLDHLERKGDVANVKGIAYKDGENKVYTGRRRLISPLDKLPYPDFDAVDFDRYLVDGFEFIRGFTTKIRDPRFYDKKRKNKRMITIPVSRGCFGKCTFCYRAYPGLRTHSFKYIFDFVEYCIDRFDVGFFTFGDECFAPNTEWNWDFLKEMEKRGLDIVFRILGMRVDTVNRDILRAYKDAGCWMIEYGFESGSQKMLNIIDKRVSVEQNRQAALLTHEAGIFTSPTLVLGMPGETCDTIGESISFLKSLQLGYKQYQMTYAMPMPGSPLYEYAKLTGRITDEDTYIEMISGKTAAGFFCNLTEESDDIVMSWFYRVIKEVDVDYFTRKLRSRMLGILAEPVIGKLYALKYLYKQGTLWQRIRNKYMEFMGHFQKKKSKRDTFQKADFSIPKIDEVFADINHTKQNRNASLREYNRRIEILINADQTQ